MAPQNLNQVFLNNTIASQISGAYSAPSAGEIGVWDVDAGAFLTGAAGSILTDAKRVQIVQGMGSGNPISTPIIDVKDIVRINYKPWLNAIPTRASQGFNTGDPASGKDVMVRIALRTTPTAYANYYQDGTAVDLSNDGYQFPLLGNFSAGRMIFNIEIPASVHNATEATFYTALKAAIENNITFNALFTFATRGVDAEMTARHLGVEFDVTVQYSDKSGPVGPSNAISPARFNAASNYAIALSAEKSQRARYGNFNRMYFPFNFPTFAQTGFKYDSIEVQYKHDWPSSTGIARAGEINTVEIYWGKGTSALVVGDAGTATLDNIFGITIATPAEILF